MKLWLSNYGEKLTSHSGILELMDDLSEALTRPDVLMLGGGNPGYVPAIQEVWQRRMRETLEDETAFHRMLGHYSAPQGRPGFGQAVAECLNEAYGWDLTWKHVAVTNGSQQAFFHLLNMFAGEGPGGERRRILFPLCPEYIGYADQGIDHDHFVSCRPRIALEGEHGFKYHIDFDQLPLDESIGAICVSRPTNPTSNVLTDDEVEHLERLADHHGIPLIVDNAYGEPFPGIVFHQVRPPWGPNTLLVFSLSKLGLPGSRTGIVVGSPEVVKALSAVNAIANLANGNLGQTLVEPMLRSGELLELCRTVVRPFYREKLDQARHWIEETFGERFPYRVHRSEGAFFLWLWFEGLPITTRELYERLKARHMIVVPGEYFIYGLSEPWRHGNECLRLSIAQPEQVVRDGIKVLGEEVARAYHPGQAPA